MTDTSSLAITHATTDSYPVPASRGSPAATDGAVSDSGAPDEEPYTIKCICSFQEDDGSTVFCERCDTWQHISCYYPGEKVPEVHNCVDCEPRPLDNRRAHERQRQRRVREKSEDGDRKPRRPGAKTQKRKTKETDVNESNLKRHDSNARDQPPAKKTKGSHRPSTSVSGLQGASAESRNRRSSTSVAMSPTNPEPTIPLYSNEFLHLYDRDDSFVQSGSNLLPGVSFIDRIISWLNDPDTLTRVTEGLTDEEFKRKCGAAFDATWPRLTTHTFTDSTTKIGGKNPMFKILKTQDSIRKNEIVGEIFGGLGSLDNYKMDPSNRWETLQHPEPFVFFSSQLPLYIDSRQEGNQLRYIRRSCDANVMLKIYITNGRQYHFCFVAKQDIPADSEITTMWYLDPTLALAYTPPSKEGSAVADNTSEIEVAATCISNTLANYGGCACERSQNCLLANLDRRIKPANSKQPKVKGKAKAKVKAVASPIEPGRASASRAGSETTKHPDEDDVATDARSTSGSARDRATHSRDVSPTTQQRPLPELSSRERRKIADAEKQFQQLEKGAVGTKRKKRVSGLLPNPASHASPSEHQKAKVGFEKHAMDDRSRSPTAVSPATKAPGRSAKSRKPPAKTASDTINRYQPSPYRRVGPYADASTQLDPDQVEHDNVWEEHVKRGYRVGVLPLQSMNRARFISGCHYEQDQAQQRAWLDGDQSVIPPGVIPWWCPYFPYPLDDRSQFDLLPEDAELMGIPADHGPLALPLRWSYYQSKQPVRPVSYGKITLMGMSHADPQVSQPQGDVVMDEAPVNTEPESSGSANVVTTLGEAAPWPSTVAHSTPISKAKHPGDLHLAMPPPAPNTQSAASPGSTSAGSLASPVFHDTAPSLPSVTTPTPAPAATPAKKKLSLGDYLMRRGTMANTPTSDRTQPPTQERPPDSSPVWVTGPQHFLAIATLPDDYGQSRTRADADSDKNEPFGSRDVPMEDAPDPAPTNTQSVSS
ncbi:Zinc finger FYVE/PHD-type [Penicillium brevicompactum]|uniref:Zinc finger FYVE/PHD-type n=1 Tax=Penicillium brevicompactum TaxID=5074 RepID=A0A9W9RMP2_PENBR|nr:Zinc finger FYVE/PHD-type [Penicillium brevicompactum]